MLFSFSGPLSSLTYLYYLGWFRGNTTSSSIDNPNYELYFGEVTTSILAAPFYDLRPEVISYIIHSLTLLTLIDKYLFNSAVLESDQNAKSPGHKCNSYCPHSRQVMWKICRIQITVNVDVSYFVTAEKSMTGIAQWRQEMTITWEQIIWRHKYATFWSPFWL